jgi:hypothetical protein
MNLKIRQYLSANRLLLMAKVFAQSVDITPSGFGSQPWLILHTQSKIRGSNFCQWIVKKKKPSCLSMMKRVF